MKSIGCGCLLFSSKNCGERGPRELGSVGEKYDVEEKWDSLWQQTRPHTVPFPYGVRSEFVANEIWVNKFEQSNPETVFYQLHQMDLAIWPVLDCASLDPPPPGGGGGREKKERLP